jgi:hypothetical protein
VIAVAAAAGAERLSIGTLDLTVAVTSFTPVEDAGPGGILIGVPTVAAASPTFGHLLLL